ncbi:MAG: HAD family phosphatase [Armatimonadetes bacterium]|nr:HAD family phosphatase [Armatimonadota bacterium]
MIDKAVLWDVNGVIIDDMRIHFVSYREVLKELGCEVNDEYLLAATVGTPPAEFFAAILPTIENPISMDEILDRKRESYLRLIKGKMQSPPGAIELMNDLQRNGFKQAVASGTTRIEVDTILAGCGVRDFFDEIVSCEDVSKGKPDPEAFLKAAALIGVDPARCVVLEDGEFGVRGAKAAGMKTIAVLNTQTRERLAAADIIVESLSEIDAQRVLKLLSA